MIKGTLFELWADGEYIDVKLPCEPLELNMLDDCEKIGLYRTDLSFDIDEDELLEALHRLNDIAKKESAFTDDESKKFSAVCAFEHTKTVDDVEYCLENMEEYDFDPDITPYEDYLEAYLQINDDDMFIGAPKSCAYDVGRMILTAHGGSLTEHGVIAPLSQGLYDKLDESELADAKKFIAKSVENSEYNVIWDPDEYERELFFSSARDDIKNGCIGFVRIDFGSGSEFWHKWFGCNEQLNTSQFKKELGLVIESLREDWLKDRCSMKQLAESIPLMDLGDRGTGFRMQTDSHIFYLRCAPQTGDYDCYCYCYDHGLLEQAMGQSEDMGEEENIGMEMN